MAAHVAEYGRVGLVFEPHVIESHVSEQVGDLAVDAVVLVFGRHAANLANAVESRESLTDLRSDRRDLDYGRR